MLLNIIVTDCSGRVVEMAGSARSARPSVPLFEVPAGSEIWADVKDDDGKHLGTFCVAHSFPTRNVTATQFEDGGLAVTDDASNTYARQ
jgi:hypothetical protein